MLDRKDVTSEMQKSALAYLIFLKRKLCGKVKARRCANGKPLIEYASKDNLSFPIVSNYALIRYFVLKGENYLYVTSLVLSCNLNILKMMTATSILKELWCKCYVTLILDTKIRSFRRSFLYGKLVKAV